jgi:hypothetical protein
VPIPTWAVGQVLASSDVNQWFVPFAVVKPGDTSRASNTAVASDPDLTIPGLLANASYEFYCYLNYEGGTQGASDIQWTWAVPASATLRYGLESVNTAGAVTVGVTHAGADVPSARTNGAGNLLAIYMSGTLVLAGTGGAITLQWAQNTSSATATIVHAQSLLRLRRLG